MLERSSLLSSRYYSPSAVSHQDFVAEYTDTNLVFSNGEPIVDHSPLGLVVRQESYAWNFPFADDFVIMNYWIKNTSGKYLTEVCIGLWTDAVVRNTKVTTPSGSSFYNKGGNGYKDSLRIAYEFDSNGDIGQTDSYLGVQFLGADKKYDSVNFVSWQFRNTSDPNFFAPQNDYDRYNKLLGYFGQGGVNRYNSGINPSSLKSPSNRSIMISAGPIKYLAPGDSVNIIFAILCAKKFGSDPASLDTEEQKKNLYSSADWALRAYYGEDKNRNDILDAGEDIDGDQKITRYILPTPPNVPKVKVVPQSNRALLYWDNSSEVSVDPISGEIDFEGYRIYRSDAGKDLEQGTNYLSTLIKIAEFDSSGNSIGFNTGFKKIQLPAPVQFPGDTTTYEYMFEVDNLLNGWQYLFTVTAFDKGDKVNKIDPLESSLIANLSRILPGTPANNSPESEIGVYPNPYYGNALWDGTAERLRKIYFYNLPEYCEITIYTLSGDVVKRMQHTPESNGSDLLWFSTYSGDGNQKFAGGEHAWDLITDNDQAIATGMYLFSVKNKNTGEVKTGKFLIIK